MRKLFRLAYKEILVTFRDIGAIVTMLLTPLLLTLAIAAAFGTGGDAVLSDIPVLIVNHDQGVFSEEIIKAFQNQNDAGLVEVQISENEQQAREQVEAGQFAALVIIPQNFSDHILPLATVVQNQMGMDLFSMSPGEIQNLPTEQLQRFGELYFQTQQEDKEPPTIEIYASPDFQISTSVIMGIIQSVLERQNMTIAGMDAISTKMIEDQLSEGGDDFAGFGDSLDFEGDGLASNSEMALPINVNVISPSGRAFNWLDYSAASMAILFLMFAVTSGGRTLLAERQNGTLQRLAITPTNNLTILVGKMAGIISIGLLQVLVLWGATSLIGAYWGTALGVIPTIFMLVLAASGAGALISAWSKSAGQAGAIGTAFSLTAAALSGSFFPRMNLPQFIRTISYITPNAWGIEIFARLQSGKTLLDILPMLGGVFLLTLIYYTIAAVGFQRKLD
jgi:ABC-2 type transport system permease protein